MLSTSLEDALLLAFALACEGCDTSLLAGLHFELFSQMVS